MGGRTSAHEVLRNAHGLLLLLEIPDHDGKGAVDASLFFTAADGAAGKDNFRVSGLGFQHCVGDSTQTKK